MKIFKYRQIGHKFKFTIFGIKASFHLSPKKNHYISLGSNCCVRMLFTKFYMKAKRKNGELSCPFDLCITPLDSLIKILQNDFSDYFDNIKSTGKGEPFVNTDYSMCFPHEKSFTLEEFKNRYTKRIENFRKISQEKALKKYVFSCEQSDFTVDNLNRVYNSLLKLRKGLPFKFYVLNFLHDNPPKPDLSGLDPAIIYYEYDYTNEFNNKWLGNMDWLGINFNGKILNKL